MTSWCITDSSLANDGPSSLHTIPTPNRHHANTNPTPHRHQHHTHPMPDRPVSTWAVYLWCGFLSLLSRMQPSHSGPKEYSYNIPDIIRKRFTDLNVFFRYLHVYFGCANCGPSALYTCPQNAPETRIVSARSACLNRKNAASGIP